MTKHLQMIVILGSLSSVYTGCVTTKTQKSSELEASSTRVSGDVVVTQTHSKSPFISDKSDSHWVDLRNNKTSALPRMQGMLATGEWRGAIEAAKADLLKHPGNPEALMGLASAHVLGGNFEMAGYYAGQVLKVQSGNSDAMNIMGLRTMMASGNRRADYQDAITWFQKSIDSDGSQIAAALNLGHLQLELGSAQDAVAPFKIAAGRCGDCDRAMLAVGVADARSGHYEDAKVALEDLSLKNPRNATAKYELAMVYKNGFQNNAKSVALLQDLVSDPVGIYASADAIKRQANIALRRIKATDRSGEGLMVAGSNRVAPAQKADANSESNVDSPTDEKPVAQPEASPASYEQ